MTNYNPFNNNVKYNNVKPQETILPGSFEPTTPPTPPPTPIPIPTPETTPNNNLITKNVCAIEINKWLRKTKILSIVAIIGFFMASTGSIFGVMGSTITSIGFIGFCAWILMTVQKEIKRLRDNYELQ